MIGIFAPAYLEAYYPAFVMSVVLALLWVLRRLRKEIRFRQSAGGHPQQLMPSSRPWGSTCT